MTVETYTLQQFIIDARQLAAATRDEKALLSQLRPLARQAALSNDWRNARHYNADTEQGFGVHVLHDEPDHSLFIAALSWLPGRGAPAHDHGTWAVVVGVDGPEKNIFWERADDGAKPGYAELRKIGEKVCEVGDVLAFPAGAIHSVTNETSRVTLSFHVYGRHLNYTGRSQYDPVKKTATPFILKTQ
jgi:predicted metal-dependent enzyme (double-stranded beta helix superfamily)